MSISSRTLSPAATVSAPTLNPLRLSVARRLLRHKSLYNNEIRPFLKRLPQFACESWCLLGHKSFGDLVMGRSSDSASPKQQAATHEEKREPFPPLEKLLRDSRGSPEMGLEALRTLALWQHRLAQSAHKSFTKVDYELAIGDVVRHTHLGHVGVVAAQLPLCFESDEWVMNNLGSTTDPRMAHPWYLVLVARHEGLPMDFVRYGSQLTHQRMNPGRSIGFHRLLPMFFQGFDSNLGRYVPTPEVAELMASVPAAAAATTVASPTKGDAVPPSPVATDLKAVRRAPAERQEDSRVLLKGRVAKKSKGNTAAAKPTVATSSTKKKPPVAKKNAPTKKKTKKSKKVTRA